MAESSVAPLHGRTCSDVKTQENTDREQAVDRLVQLALHYAPPAPVLTCRCGNTAFRTFPGPSGRAYRCTRCWTRADTALCSCSHGYRAHSTHGCMGVQDDGSMCECQLKGGR